MAKKSKEEWKIYGNVFDNFTINTIRKLMSQNIIEGIESPVKIGKEANIFTARTKDGGKRVLKIYRLESCNFNLMYKYIKSDPRFFDLKKQRRKVIFAWVKREYRNLIASRKSGVRVPTPITSLNNIIVLEYIGNKEPAPQIKDNTPEDYNKFFNEIIDNIRKLYLNAGLVHADLSEYNILNYLDNPVFIDFSQATTLKDPLAEEYLRRDISNITKFFNRFGFEASEEEVLQKIKSSA
ncbi:MAG: serine protein kinase RIO [Nanobdellota archaeon]